MPGQPAYNPNPPFPPRSIKVSVDAADYPPFSPVPPVEKKPVVGEGFLTNNGQVFLAGPGANMSTLSEGQVVEQNGQKYIAHYNAARNPPVTFTKA